MLLRRDRLRDLVRVVRRGQPGSDVEELVNAGFSGQVPDLACEELPVLPHPDAEGRAARDEWEESGRGWNEDPFGEE